jgi:hypothetical protein
VMELLAARLLNIILALQQLMQTPAQVI